MKKDSLNIHFKNKKVFFDYTIEKEYIAGIVLQGNEAKALRLEDGCHLTDSFCRFDKDELFAKFTIIE